MRTVEQSSNPDFKEVFDQRSYWGVLGASAKEYFAKVDPLLNSSCHLEFYRRFQSINCACTLKNGDQKTEILFSFPTTDDVNHTLAKLRQNTGNEISDILTVLKLFSQESNKFNQ